MKRHRDAIPALLLIALGWNTAFIVAAASQQQAVAQAGSPLAVGVCYATDGTNIETAYITGGSSSYPIASSGVVEQTETGFQVTHRAVFEDRGMRVYLPVLRRE